MKLLIAILLAVILSGCTMTNENPEVLAQQTTVQPQPTEQTTAPLETALGTYLADSPVEAETDGAVQVFAPNVVEALRLYPMGDRLVLLSGGQSSVLTVLDEQTLAICEQRELNCLISMDVGGIWVGEQGITYVDEVQGAVVFLDTGLNETKRVRLPADMRGNALISPDLDQVFYCADNAVRAMELGTGLTRLIKTQDVAHQSLWGVYLDGEALCCYSEDWEGNGQTVYFSTENGATLYDDKPLQQLATDENRYLVCFNDGSVRVCLIGQMEEEPRVLGISQTAQPYPVLSDNALVTVEASQQSTELSYFDLGSGQTQSTVTLPDAVFVSDVTAYDEIVCFLAYLSGSDVPVICRWDIAKSETGSADSFYLPYSTAQTPDEDGLLQCAESASKIGEKFGVDILVWEDALIHQPSDQRMEAEYQVAAYERDLQVLETALDKFPEGFLQALVSGTYNEKLTISLVRSIHGDNALGSLEESQGVQFWLDESAYITLAMGYSMEQSLYHELCHVIDNRVIGTTLAFDAWADLNPYDFEYDYSYITNGFRQDYRYLEGDDAAFIDMYSMSYPKEDRARILEYAMMPGNEGYFDSEILQNKLRVLCAGIREAFELEESGVYPWEQYLHKPLTDQ